MADPLSVTGNNPMKVDLSKWKKLTAQEIIKEESKGEEIPAEILNWAQQMAAFSKIPDNVTYEQVDGDVGIDALDKLGIEDNPEGSENAITAEKTEEPDAVKDPAKTDGEEPLDNENIFLKATPGQAAEAKPTEQEKPEDELALADENLNTNPEIIRKRKERKGLA